ncbi:hypothetical protein Tsubulata_010903 [Turnera subulata]|uniref:F-box domain-containing protein n=1 Tax=Turnera subulata TaxID=218843 RepID=A0A9Q0FYH2_9ROSI|nr:hypothetical protein Tsubulata_010903 [Turnera subulata]
MENAKRRRVSSCNVDAQKQPVFPVEIFCEILARLPVESILRCRSVCRSWLSMIRSSFFINLQQNISNDKPPQFIVQSQSSADMNNLYLLDMGRCKLREIRLENIELRTRFKLQLPGLEIRCSCDGLLCMASDQKLDPIFICNPITRECVILPLSRLKSFVVSHQIGFGFDKLSQKYKIIREYRTSNNKNESQFQIITLGESSWRQLNPPPNVSVSQLDAAVFWNGSLHWVVDFKTGNESILALDLSDEKFHTIPFPKFRFSGEYFELLVLRGSLTIVEHESTTMKIWKVTGNKIEGFSVHCMDEYDTHVCWNRYHCYTTFCHPNCDSLLLQVCLTDNRNAKRDWFTEFVPGMEVPQYFHPNIRGLPNHFRTVSFSPSFVSPIAAPMCSKSATSLREQLSLISSEWTSCFGFHCPKPNNGILTSLFFSKWRWA